jgi:hypothetical protein
VEITQGPLPQVQPPVNVCLTADEATSLREFFGELSASRIRNIMLSPSTRVDRLVSAMYVRLRFLNY